MVTCKVYSQVGELIGSVSLSLSKSDVGYRLQTKLFEKGSGVIPRDLERLDANDLPIATLAKCYSQSEIRNAIVKQAGDLRKSADAAIETLDRLDRDDLWGASRLRKGYDAGRGRSAAEVIDALEKHSYRDVSGKQQHYAHRDGHTCSVKRDGSWSHRRAPGHVMSGLKAAGLRRFLSSTHGV